MTLALYRPYPGTALLATPQGSVLIGVPADAFKATKQFCERHQVAFPRILVAPPCLLARGVPQFVPEFFLYDFLFMHGAAFKPELANTKLQFVLPLAQQARAQKALRMTLLGPSEAELQAYARAAPHSGLDQATIQYLSTQSASMAIKKAGVIRSVDEMVDMQTPDAQGNIRLLDDSLRLQLLGGNRLLARAHGEEVQLDLSLPQVVVPFAGLPPPQAAMLPASFAVQTLGTRSGFDLSGPTTGFVIWLHGKALLFDGPAGTPYLLEQQGISHDDLDGIILSHCHEDHMGAFVEMVLLAGKLKVYTAEPIYRSALVKLASYFHISEDAAAQYLNYVPVVPGQPIDILGARCNFFYTVHAIPTLGVQISLRHNGVVYACQLSGDTMHHKGLDSLHQEGILGHDKWQMMRHLVPPQKQAQHLYFADVGEALIHGHPQDWADNPNQVIYYHCPNNAHTQQFKHKVADAGNVFTLLPAPRHFAITPARLLRALEFLNVGTADELSMLLHQGTHMSYASGALLPPTPRDAPQLGIVLAGRLRAHVAVAATAADSIGHSPSELGAGDIFGMLGNLEVHQAQPLMAILPSEIFYFDAQGLLAAPVAAPRLALLQRLLTLRPLLDASPLLQHVEAHVRNILAAHSNLIEHAAGASWQADGALYVLLAGELAYGEAFTPQQRCCAEAFISGTHWQAVALTPVRLLQIPAALLQQLGARFSWPNLAQYATSLL